jgi:hypothetical protein
MLLAYPLLYPRGGLGYSRGQKLEGLTVARNQRKNMNITPIMHYRWLIFQRRKGTDILLCGEMLFSQWLIDAFITDDFKNLEFYRFNQKTLRADK